MSHEFRTPLGSIRSIARILLDRLDGPLTEEQERRCASSRPRPTELTEMVDDLLDLAKVEAGRVDDLAGLVRDGRPVLGAARHVQADAHHPSRCR